MAGDDSVRSTAYVVEYCPSGRTQCRTKKCERGKVEKGQIRFGSISNSPGQSQTSWKHVECVSPVQARNVLSWCNGEVNRIDKWSTLSKSDQERVSNLLKQLAADAKDQKDEELDEEEQLDENTTSKKDESDGEEKEEKKIKKKG